MDSPTAGIGSLSVVVPAYNAASHVCPTLDEIQSYLQRIEVPYEVIVVDDGSEDQTADAISRRGRGVRLIRNETNRGKGFTVRRGMLAATCDWVLFTDVDNATGIEHLGRFMPLASEYDIVIASRRLPDSKILRPQPRFRQMLGRMFPYLVRATVLPQFADTQCGFKLFRRNVARELFGRAKIDRFCFDVEILTMAVERGYRVAEAPVEWRNPERGSTLRIGRDTLLMLGDLIRIASRRRRGLYRL